ncbi:MAG TPA: hypothetical protein VFW66_05830, partial [Gemmatimonadales bacterium]|nr:hypothetical protein [Gemmatimonadales bacterium]
ERLRSPAAAGSGAPPHAPVTIAVLPFANLTADGDKDYFAEGLAEELMRGLAQVDSVRVAARSSACAAGAAGLDAREIGRRLSVRALVEGSVRQARDRVRLSAQLVDARDGCQLWSEMFERRVDDVFSAQDELAAAIVRALDAPLRRLASSAMAAPSSAARDQADAR